MFSSSSIKAQSLWVCVVVSWYVVENFYFWYHLDIVIVCHEDTDALAEVTDMDADIQQEVAAFPSSCDHGCFRVHFGQIYFHGKP